MDARRYLPTLAAILLVAGWGCRESPQGQTASKVDALRVWTTESDPETLRVMEDVGRQLTSASPQVRRVEVLSVKWSELNVKLQQAFEAGQMPAVTHLEPFFTRFFVDKDLLIPLDDVVQKLGEKDILPAVQRVAYFNGHYYGICQHFGVSFIACRKDLLDKSGIALPKTWQDMLAAAEKLTKPGQYGIYFPGGDRFFVDAIFFEVLASNGGHAFDSNGKPDLDNARVIQSLEYMAKLVRFAPPDWQNATYVEGFPKMVRGNVAINLFVGARATKTFDDEWKDREKPPNVIFMPLEPPHGPGGRAGTTSVDCEPFVLINQKKNKGLSASDATTIEAAGRLYLELLYRRDNYMKLMRSAPIQLIPIFRSMQDEYAQDPFIKRWRPWYDQAVRMIEQGRANPYFTTNLPELSIPYLFELYGEKVITEMVSDVLTGGKSPGDAARLAQKRALQIADRYK